MPDDFRFVEEAVLSGLCAGAVDITTCSLSLQRTRSSLVRGPMLVDWRPVVREEFARIAFVASATAPISVEINEREPTLATAVGGDAQLTVRLDPGLNLICLVIDPDSDRNEENVVCDQVAYVPR